MVGADFAQPFACLIRDVEDGCRHELQVELEQQIQARAERQHAGHVLRAALVAGRRRLELKLDARVVARMNNAVPADTDRSQPIEMFATDVGDASSFGAQHPLVPVGGEEVDGRLTHVERKCADALNRVEHHQRPASVSNFDDLWHVVPIAGRVADPADRNDSRPRIARGRQLVEIEPAIFCWDAARLDAATGQVQPRIGVRRKLVGERDDVVARPPIESLGNQS